MKQLAMLCLTVAAVARPGQAVAGERTIDLAAASNPATVVVPEGEDLEIALANVAPSAKCRLTFKDRFGARSQPLVNPRFAGFDAYVPPPACAELKKEGQALLASVDEAEVPRLLKALQPKLATGPCSPRS